MTTATLEAKTTDFDVEGLTGTLHGRGAADMRAARIGVKVAFTLRDDPAEPRPTTRVKVVSDAELGGVLADFARTGGVAVANVIMTLMVISLSVWGIKDVFHPQISTAVVSAGSHEVQPYAADVSGNRGAGAPFTITTRGTVFAAAGRCASSSLPE